MPHPTVHGPFAAPSGILLPLSHLPRPAFPAKAARQVSSCTYMSTLPAYRISHIAYRAYPSRTSPIPANARHCPAANIHCKASHWPSKLGDSNASPDVPILPAVKRSGRDIDELNLRTVCSSARFEDVSLVGRPIDTRSSNQEHCVSVLFARHGHQSSLHVLRRPGNFSSHEFNVPSGNLLPYCRPSRSPAAPSPHSGVEQLVTPLLRRSVSGSEQGVSCPISPIRFRAQCPPCFPPKRVHLPPPEGTSNCASPEVINATSRSWVCVSFARVLAAVFTKCRSPASSRLVLSLCRDPYM